MKTTRILTGLITSLIVVASAKAADDFAWNVTGPADWNDPGNWLNINIGTGNNDRFVNNGGTAVVTSNTILPIRDIKVGLGSGNSGTVNNLSGTHSSGGGNWIFIGHDGGTGTYNLADTNTSGGTLTGFGQGSGSLTNGGQLRIGQGGGGNGMFRMNTTGTVSVSDSVNVGFEGGTGSFLMDNGTVTSGGNLNVGTGGGNGTFNISGGSVTSNDPKWGDGGTATVNMSGGSVTGNGWTFVGDNGGTANVTMSNGTFEPKNRFYLGIRNGTANFTLSGGTINANEVHLGDNHELGINGGTANVTISGGIWNTNNIFQVGRNGAKGFVNQSNGIVNVNNGWFGIGNDNAGSTGSYYNMTGGQLNLNNGVSAEIGADTGGSMTLSGNAAMTANRIIVGFRTGGTGGFTMSGTADVTSRNGTFILGHNGGATGTADLNGGTLTAPGIERGGGNATFNFNGTTIKASGSNANFFAGGLDATNTEIQAGGLIIDSNGFNLTVATSLDGTGPFTKLGNGTVTLSGTPTYSGLTTVSQGTLTVTGSNTAGGGLSANGTVNFGNGGTTGIITGNALINGTLNFERTDDLTFSGDLTGEGQINKNRANKLILSGANSLFEGSLNANVGTTVLNSNFGGIVAVAAGAKFTVGDAAVATHSVTELNLLGGSITDFEFSAGGATNDRINVTAPAALSFDTSYTFNFLDVGAATPFSTNGTYTLFGYNTSFSGALSNLSVGNPVSGKGYVLSDDATNDLVLLTISDNIVTQWANVGGGLWSNAGNWTAGVPNIATAEAIFGTNPPGITAPSTVDIDGNKTVGKINFDNTNAYTISGTGTLTIDNGMASGLINVLNGAHTISVPVALDDNTSIITAASSSLLINGDISGARSLTASGTGTLTLAGTNAYTTTSLTGGTLSVGNGGTSGTLGSGNVSTAGGANLNFNRTDSYTFGGNITGAGNINQNGTGTTTLTGTVSTSGAIAVNAGTLVTEGTVSNASSLTVNGTATHQGAGTTSISGPVTVGTTATGTLNIQGSQVFTSTGALTLGNSAAVAGNATVGGTASATVNNILIGNAAGSNSSLTVNDSAALTSSGTVLLGTNGSTGTLTLNTTGTVTVGGDIIAGGASGNTGHINVQNGTLNQTTGLIRVGLDAGGGSYTQSGGTVTTGSGGMRIADGGAGGTVNAAVSGGTLNVNNELWVGNGTGNTSTFTMSNGTVNVNSWLAVGRLNATGTVQHTGGTINKTGGTNTFVIIGSLGGTGVYNQSGTASLTSNGDINVGENLGATRGQNNYWNMSGGSAAANENIIIGYQSSDATWDFSGGTATAGRLVVGAHTSDNTAGTANGTVLMSGGTLNLLNGDSQIGGRTGGQTANTGVMLITGGTINNSTNFQTGSRGIGAVVMSAGTFNSNGWDAIGRFGGSNGNFNISGGTYTHTGGGTAPIIGEEGTGTLTVSGTGLYNSLGDQGIRIGHTATANGTLQLDGGTLGARYILKSNGASTANIYLNGGTIRANANEGNFFQGMDASHIELQSGGLTFDTNGNTVGISQALDGVGGLNKTGLGALTLSGATTYTGPTNVNQGTLIVTGSLSGSATTVNNGGTLGGNGTVAGLTVNSGGILAPGLSPGDITATGPVAFNTGSILSIELASLVSYDQLTLASTSGLTINGGNVALSLGYAPTIGDAFTLVENNTLGGITGFFSNLAQAGIIVTQFGGGDYYFQANYSGGDGNDLILTTVVPEPTTGVALIGGLALLFARRRRRA